MSKTKDCQFCGPNKLTVVHLLGGGYGVRIVDKYGVESTYGHEDCTPFETREEAIKELGAWIVEIQELYMFGGEFINNV